MPWGVRGESAYRAGYDGRGELTFADVATPGCSAMLVRPETLAAHSPSVRPACLDQRQCALNLRPRARSRK